MVDPGRRALAATGTVVPAWVSSGVPSERSPARRQPAPGTQNGCSAVTRIVVWPAVISSTSGTAIACTAVTVAGTAAPEVESYACTTSPARSASIGTSPAGVRTSVPVTKQPCVGDRGTSGTTPSSTLASSFSSCARRVASSVPFLVSLAVLSSASGSALSGSVAVPRSVSTIHLSPGTGRRTARRPPAA